MVTDCIGVSVYTSCRLIGILDRRVWGGHACPPLLTLIFDFDFRL